MVNSENLEMRPFVIKNGVILGLIGAALAMAMYIIDYALIVNWKFQVISLITSLHRWSGTFYRVQSGQSLL